MTISSGFKAVAAALITSISLGPISAMALVNQEIDQADLIENDRVNQLICMDTELKKLSYKIANNAASVDLFSFAAVSDSFASECEVGEPQRYISVACVFDVLSDSFVTQAIGASPHRYGQIFTDVVTQVCNVRSKTFYDQACVDAAFADFSDSPESVSVEIAGLNCGEESRHELYRLVR